MELGETGAVLLDVDGTLVDSTYYQAIAWDRAFTSVGVTVPVWQLHRHVGMGGDKLVAAVAGTVVEQQHGDEIRAAHDEAFAELRPAVRPLAGARNLLLAVAARGLKLAVATSGKQDEAQNYLDLLECGEVVDVLVATEDVDRSKPDADVFGVALDRLGTRAGLVIGDSPWDCQAANAAALPAIGMRCGGFAGSELRSAGALAVLDDPESVSANLSAILGDQR